MSNLSLTAKYRPQTFAEVAGQETLKKILSRASLEDRVAPAYLFSGTRGVGKTTIARIFAKALNCRNAPTAEPCNACDQCRAVTMGNAVDVIEIDGASNRGIDDVRRLKEVVGYAPMEGRYKIFIIDEAHMLSREAFNALLKTLEEPPARVTFIMATTEPHKFPATIISRCQHYVFKRLPEGELVAHLSSVLSREGLEFSSSAVQLIARRGAGSVRDSMSLLGQVLALGGETLTEEITRSVLGLAGQDALLQVAHILQRGETLPLVTILRELLDQGLDIGFFLRELAGLWRNLFILQQAGEAGFDSIDVPDNQKRELFELAQHFSLSHIHAAWQMTLEGQRRVLTSLEPGLALELLLMNLAMLPQLLSLDGLSALARRAGASKAAVGTHPPSGGSVRPPAGNYPPRSGYSAAQSGKASTFSPGDTSEGDSPGQPQPSPPGSISKEQQGEKANNPAASFSARSEVTQKVPAPLGREDSAPFPPEIEQMPSGVIPFAVDDAPEKSFANDEPLPESTDKAEQRTFVSEQRTSRRDNADGVDSSPAILEEEVFSAQGKSSAAPAQDFFPVEKPVDATHTLPAAMANRPEWDDIVAKCMENGAPPWFVPLAKNVVAAWRNDVLQLRPKDGFAGQRIMEPTARQILDEGLSALCGSIPKIELQEPMQRKEDHEVVKTKVFEHPTVKALEDSFDARIIDFGQIR